MGSLCLYHDSGEESYVHPRSPWYRGLAFENAGVTGNSAPLGIWHPRIKFPLKFGTPSGSMESLNYAVDTFSTVLSRSTKVAPSIMASFKNLCLGGLLCYNLLKQNQQFCSIFLYYDMHIPASRPCLLLFIV